MVTVAGVWWIEKRSRLEAKTSEEAVIVTKDGEWRRRMSAHVNTSKSKHP